MSMQAFVLGTGGMMPLPGRHLTSVLLRRDGNLFLFDCGEGTQVSLRALNLKWKKISAIFISHTHADHVTGLPGILMLSSQVDRDEPLYIIGPPRIAEYVWSNRHILEMYINFEIKVEEIEDPHRQNVVYSGNGFRVRSFPLDHTRVCVGYTLEEQKRPGIFHPELAESAGVPRGPLWRTLQNGEPVRNTKNELVRPEEIMGEPRCGRKFSYVTDTAFNASISQEIRNSDLLMCEGMFTQDLSDEARTKKHLTARDAGKLAARAGGVLKMGLIHYSPRYANSQLRDLEKEAKRHFPGAFAAFDRQSIAIPYRDEADA